MIKISDYQQCEAVIHTLCGIDLACFLSGHTVGLHFLPPVFTWGPETGFS